MQKYFLLTVLAILLGFGVASAGMKTDYQRIIQLGGVLLDIESEASQAMSRMGDIKVRLGKMKTAAESKFGVGSPEAVEVANTISGIKTQFADAATAW